MTKEIGNSAINLMNNSSQDVPHESIYMKMKEGLQSENIDVMKEQDLSLKKTPYGEVSDYRQHQGLMRIKKQEDNNDKNSGNQTVPSMNHLSAISHPDSSYFIPVHHMTNARLNTQASSFAHSSNNHLGSLDLGSNEASKKRELRLLKNKEAAKECRRKKKEYVRCLEGRVNLLENQNKTLIEELKSLKELYCQKDV